MRKKARKEERTKLTLNKKLRDLLLQSRPQGQHMRPHRGSHSHPHLAITTGSPGPPGSSGAASAAAFAAAFATAFVASIAFQYAATRAFKASFSDTICGTGFIQVDPHPRAIYATYIASYASVSSLRRYIECSSCPVA